jgi:hypothetical protein
LLIGSLFQRAADTFLSQGEFKPSSSDSADRGRKHLTPERFIDLYLQTFPKLLFLLVPKVTTRSLYPECIAIADWLSLSESS